MKPIYVYQCDTCEEWYEHETKGVHYCDWFDCENMEPLEYIRKLDVPIKTIPKEDLYK